MSRLSYRRLGRHGASRYAGALLATFLLLATESATPASGQLVDRGTFRILVDGREIGTEEFRIERRGTGDAQTTFASSRISLRDGREIVTLLRLVGPDLVLAEYSASETGADTTSVRLARSGEHLRAISTTKWGEKMRSYRARPATFVLDAGVAHHYFVFGRFAEDGTARQTLHAFSRGSEGLAAVVVMDAGQESIELGGESLEATRVDFSTGDGTGTVWFDGSGRLRLVRVTLADGSFVAEKVPDSGR